MFNEREAPNATSLPPKVFTHPSPASDFLAKHVRSTNADKSFAAGVRLLTPQHQILTRGHVFPFFQLKPEGGGTTLKLFHNDKISTQLEVQEIKTGGSLAGKQDCVHTVCLE